MSILQELKTNKISVDVKPGDGSSGSGSIPMSSEVVKMSFTEKLHHYTIDTMLALTNCVHLFSLQRV
jgi:hypothetical protein